MAELDAWYYRLMGDVMGPVTSKTLKDLAKNGSIEFDTQVRKGADGDWVSAASIKGLFTEQVYVQPIASSSPQPKTTNTSESSQAPSAVHKRTVGNTGDRKLPYSLELLSFGLVRIAMMIIASIAVLAVLWFLILLLINLPNVQTNPIAPSLYSTIKTRSRADMKETNNEADQKADTILVDDTVVIVRGIPFGVPKRLKGVLSTSDAEYIVLIYKGFERKHLPVAWEELREFLSQIDKDKELKDKDLRDFGSRMIYLFCYDQEKRFSEIDSRETERSAALVGAWSGLTATFLMLVGVVLILVLLAIERNTRRA